MAVDVSDSAATPAQGDSKEAIVERAKQASVYIESQYPTVVCIFVPALILDSYVTSVESNYTWQKVFHDCFQTALNLVLFGNDSRNTAFLSQYQSDVSTAGSNLFFFHLLYRKRK